MAQSFNFGASVAVGPNEVLIGQPENQYAPGFVYAYRAGPKGEWKLIGKLSADGAANNDGFGKSIALDGNTALISSIAADSARGAVFVFNRSAAGAWKQAARFTAPDAAPGDSFGRHVAVAGDLAAISSSRGSSAGAVHLFTRASDGRWMPDTTLMPSDSEPKGWYGGSVAIAGGRLFVGAAALRSGRADSASGSVYIYAHGGSGWHEEARLSPGRGETRTGFGVTLLPKGDTLLVGAPGYGRGAGAVFLFVRDSTGKWVSTTRLQPFDAGPQTLFGAGVAEVGSELWVGAPGAAGLQGRVYRFTHDTSGWTAASKLAVPGLGDQGISLFGLSLAASNSAAVVTTPGRDFFEGSAALFSPSAKGWKLDQQVVGDVASLAALTGAKRECTGGKVSIFDCQQVDLMSFLPVKDIGGGRGVELNDIWGYTDPQTGHEYALVGRIDGTAFVDITSPSHPVFVGDLPKTSTAPASIWRDIKTYRHYAFIVADGAREHGMQVFDLDKLRHPGREPVRFTEDAHYSLIHSAHNIVIDTTTGYAYLVGGSAGGETCGGGLHMVDIHDPLHPRFVGCFADSTVGRAGTGYVHDAQCVVYHGPDTKFQNHEVCFDFAETAVAIADVTDKNHPKALSHQAYPNVGYAHQGWLTEDQKYVYEDDELDELEGLVDGTRTLIWDVSDLENPVLAGEYISKDKASDHNLFVVGNTVYQSNYLSGLRVLDIADRLHPKQIGFFDTVPVGPDVPGFGGSWGNYPFYASGVVAVTSMKEGLFVLKAHPGGAIP